MGEKWAGSTCFSPPGAAVGSQNGEVGLGVSTVNSFLVSKDSGTSLKLVSRSTRGGAAITVVVLIELRHRRLLRNRIDHITDGIPIHPLP